MRVWHRHNDLLAAKGTSSECTSAAFDDGKFDDQMESIQLDQDERDWATAHPADIDEEDYDPYSGADFAFLDDVGQFSDDEQPFGTGFQHYWDRHDDCNDTRLQTETGGLSASDAAGANAAESQEVEATTADGDVKAAYPAYPWCEPTAP